jgi:hypothetical protein
VEDDQMVAFATRVPEPPALEVRVNFGVFAGREATPAEIDELARTILPALGEVSIVAEQRHEISDRSEISLQQVRIEVAGDHLPDSEPEIEELSERLVVEAARWARACVADRRAEVSEP